MELPGHLAPACRLYLKRTDIQRLLAARLGRAQRGTSWHESWNGAAVSALPFLLTFLTRAYEMGGW